MNFFTLLLKGGIVMVPLFVCSLIAVAILFERIRFYRHSHTDISALRQQLPALLENQRWDEVKVLCRKVGGRAAIIIAEALDYDQSEAKQEKFIELKSMAAATEYRKYLNYLSTIVTLAPLMGLLGTVTGMISSFSVLSVSEGQPFAITGGVGEALVATATGLCVAMIALLIHTYLKQWQDLLISEMEELGSLYLLILGDDIHEA